MDAQTVITYLKAFTQFFPLILDYIKQFLALLGINFGSKDEETTTEG